jgi:hypothetical protein
MPIKFVKDLPEIERTAIRKRLFERMKQDKEEEDAKDRKYKNRKTTIEYNSACGVKNRVVVWIK